MFRSCSENQAHISETRKLESFGERATALNYSEIKIGRVFIVYLVRAVVLWN